MVGLGVPAYPARNKNRETNGGDRMTWDETREQAKILFSEVNGVSDPQPYADTSLTGRMRYVGYKDDRGRRHDYGQGLSWETAVRKASTAQRAEATK